MALAVTFALGFVVGKGSSRAAEAAENPAASGKSSLAASPLESRRPGTAPGAPSEADAPGRATATPVPAGDATPRIEESPLFDPQNLWTVVVAAYSNSSEDLAWATYEHLSDQELSVFPPIQSGKVLIVLVGAAPTSAELADTEAAVRALVRDGQKAYDTAYRARIDKLIPRSPRSIEKAIEKAPQKN